MIPFVVGLSSPSGGGKTTIAQQLAATAGAAVVLAFDDYDDLAEGANVHPPDLQQWLAAGADYHAWQMPRLFHDINQLKQGEPIASPVDGRRLLPQPLLVLDVAFGRAHTGLSVYLDFMIYIDTPLDVALARRLQRDYFAHPSTDPQATLQAIHAMTTAYVTWARAAYLAMDRQVKPQCDLIVDGCLPSQTIVEELWAAIQTRLPGRL